MRTTDRLLRLNLAVPAAICLAVTGCQPSTQTGGETQGVPTFRSDPGWPSVPVQWRLGEVSSIAIDAQDNAWFLHRPYSIPAEEADLSAPPVLGFDADGDFIDAWGGPSAGYEWPEREHGLQIDHEGFFWITGNNCPATTERGLGPISDDQVLKLTPDGEFVLQIGRANSSRGNADTANLNEPADAVVHPPTNEVFVADGYGNHRVAVFDADTGAFKRLWGAFGNLPEDADNCPRVFTDSVPDGPGPPQFSIVHAIRVSNDDLVYVADRENRRVQVFTLAGDYIDQIIYRDAPFARNLALSPDAEQRFLYVGGGEGIMVFDRASLEFLTTIETAVGTGHLIQTDSQGNIYIAATGVGYERLIFTGITTPVTD